MREGLVGAVMGVLIGIMMIVLIAVFVPAPAGEEAAAAPTAIGGNVVDEVPDTDSALDEIIEDEEPLQNDEETGDAEE